MLNEGAKVDIDIINHFYVSNMGIDRKSNPPLSDYKMIARKKNWIEYVPKTGNDDIMDLTSLENMLELKKNYQNGAGLPP